MHCEHGQVKHEVQKEFKIALSNAVCGPNAVVIHAENAATASAAVMCPRWLDALTRVATG